jgi:hypothetical protein
VPQISHLQEFLRVHREAVTTKTALHDLKQLAPLISDEHAVNFLLKTAESNFLLASELSSVFIRVFSPKFPVLLVNAVVKGREGIQAVELLIVVVKIIPRIAAFARHRAFFQVKRRCDVFEVSDRLMPILNLSVGECKFLFVGLGEEVDWETGEISCFI